MKSRSASAVFGKIYPLIPGLALLILLAACDDADLTLPHVFSGNEVPPAVTAEPRVVPVPPPVDPAAVTYPLVGNVPSRPKNFPPQTEIDAAKADLETQRAEGVQLRGKMMPIGTASP